MNLKLTERLSTCAKAVLPCAFALGICIFLADPAKAGLVNVTSVSQSVRLVDTSIGIDKTDSSTNLAGAFTQVIEGSGENETGGHRSRVNSTYSDTSLSTFSVGDLPVAAPIDPDAFTTANATVLFTAMDNATMSATANNEFSGGSPTSLIDTHFTFKLTDLTDSIVIFDGSDGYEDGNLVGTGQLSYMGSIISGHDYRLEYTYGFDKFQNAVGGRGTAVSNLTFTAPVPEPGSGLLFAAGVGAISVLRRRRK